VDHAHLPTPQPWRSAALIAASVATVELCILVVLGIVFFGKFFNGRVEKASDPVAVAEAAVARETAEATKSTKQAQEPILERRETSVIVLNGNGVAGAAATMAERVHSRRYMIAGTDNAPRSVARSMVMYRPGFDREAKRLAHDVGIGVQRVSPLDGLRPRQLQGAHLALIIGAR
jgi:LytR cell envelope-related transcriptional attenuator